MLDDLTGVPFPDPPDPLFEPFWNGTNEHRIMMPRCTPCDRTVWPPRDFCPRCRADELVWTEHPTTGRLYSWTTVWKATAQGYTDVPYAVGLIELDDESARILGNVIHPDLQSLQIGMLLRAHFVPAGEAGAFTLVQWHGDARPPSTDGADESGGES